MTLESMESIPATKRTKRRSPPYPTAEWLEGAILQASDRASLAERLVSRYRLRATSGHGSAFGLADTGSGALGFEALSRGADSLVSVDRAAAAIAQVRANARTLGVEERVRTLRADASAALGRLGREGARFGLVLFDPPYAAGLHQTLLAKTVQAGILAERCQVVVESDRRHAVGRVAGLEAEDERRYGDTLVTFYRAAATATAIAQED